MAILAPSDNFVGLYLLIVFCVFVVTIEGRSPTLGANVAIERRRSPTSSTTGTFERRRSTSGAIVTFKGRSPALRRTSSRVPGPSAWTSSPASVATVTFAGLRTFVVISHNPQSPSVCCARSLLRSTDSWGRWARICQLLSRRWTKSNFGSER